MSALVLCVPLLAREVSSFLRRSKCVPSGDQNAAEGTHHTSGMPWTDCQDDTGTRVGSEKNRCSFSDIDHLGLDGTPRPRWRMRVPRGSLGTALGVAKCFHLKIYINEMQICLTLNQRLFRREVQSATANAAGRSRLSHPHCTHAVIAMWLATSPP